MCQVKQGIKTVLCSYGVIVRPWLCVVAYLWVLGLQAGYRDDYERFVDVLADTALILWTLSLWAALFAAVVTSAALFLRRETLHRANEYICRILCIIVSSFFLNRWIESWWPEELNRTTTYWLLIVVVACLCFLARRRRKHATVQPVSIIPSWRNCFCFAALPVLVFTIIVVGFKLSIVAAGEGNTLRQPPGTILPHGRATPPPNVIVLMSDSLRAQSLSVYGQGGAATPFLERFANESSVFLDMHANATTTESSIASLIWGRPQFEHGPRSRDVAPQRHRHDVVSLLRQAGYTTAAVTSNTNASLSRLGLAESLSEAEILAFKFLPFSGLRHFGVSPTIVGLLMYREFAVLVPFLGYPEPTSVYGIVANTLDGAKTLIPRLARPFFVFIHIHEPHEPHRLPANFEPILLPEHELKAMGVNALRAYSHYPPIFQPVVDAYKIQYESKVRLLDIELGRFFGFLKEQSWFDKSLVILTADHGESFERGYLYHGEELYENSTRLPLLMRFPDQKSGERVKGLVQTTDIAPTILRAVSIEPPPWLDGQALTQGTPPAERATVAINYKQPERDVSFPLPTKLAIWWKQYKLITGCDYGPIELYDLAKDPGEQVNLAERQTEMVAELRLKLKQHLAKQSQPARLTCAKLS